jgi:hypothetical protein
MGEGQDRDFVSFVEARGAGLTRLAFALSGGRPCRTGLVEVDTTSVQRSRLRRVHGAVDKRAIARAVGWVGALASGRRRSSCSGAWVRPRSLRRPRRTGLGGLL